VNQLLQLSDEILQQVARTESATNSITLMLWNNPPLAFSLTKHTLGAQAGFVGLNVTCAPSPPPRVEPCSGILVGTTCVSLGVVAGAAGGGLLVVIVGGAAADVTMQGGKKNKQLGRCYHIQTPASSSISTLLSSTPASRNSRCSS